MTIGILFPFLLIALASYSLWKSCSNFDHLTDWNNNPVFIVSFVLKKIYDYSCGLFCHSFYWFYYFCF